VPLVRVFGTVVGHDESLVLHDLAINMR
jgi:hypothetical protein